ncbi:MAG: heme exporter protein CcmD [Emcibacteraceae bacterium]|nr:heme exporter protein CcmD [Emcibacteraceae bacterium]MDG1858677.1 heme exporter protein CcmD [Emcibacteraceae bacterium]
MGEYAIFVWSCYGAVVILLTALCIQSYVAKRNDEKKLENLQSKFDEISSQDK